MSDLHHLPKADLHSVTRAADFRCSTDEVVLSLDGVPRALNAVVEELRVRWPYLRTCFLKNGSFVYPTLQVPHPWLQVLLSRTSNVLCAADLWTWLKPVREGRCHVRVPLRESRLRSHIIFGTASAPPSDCSGESCLSLDRDFFGAASALIVGSH